MIDCCFLRANIYIYIWVKGVSAYLILWKDIDYNVMSRIFDYIVILGGNLNKEGLRGKVIRKRKVFFQPNPSLLFSYQLPKIYLHFIEYTFF